MINQLCFVTIQLQIAQWTMKNIQLFLFLSIAFFFTGPAKISAQGGITININQQPQWGPVEYDYVEYYYMPEYDIYYYAPQKQFVYLKGNKWVTARTLPAHYSHANLYNTYKVVINEPKPYLKHKYYSDHYKGYKGKHSSQGLIRDSKDAKYSKHNGPSAQSSHDRGIKASQRKAQIIGSKNDKGGQKKKKN